VRIRAERDDLFDALSRAGRAVGTRTTLPILQGLLVEAVGRSIRALGTDRDVTIRTAMDVEVMEEGRTVVPARLATEAVRKLPSGAVTFEARDGEVVISGGGPRFRFREFNVDDFPVFDEPDASSGVDIDGTAFAQAVGQVAVAASGDDARPLLTGVYFERNDGALRLVATDSYRLAVRDIADVDADLSGLVPVRALREIGRTVGAERLRVAIGERDATFASDRGTMTARLIEGTFPNYRQLIPETQPNRLVVDRSLLLEAIDRASLVAEDHIPIRLTLRSEGVELSVTRQDVGGETEHVDGEYTGEEMTVAFNSRYLNDGVTAIDSDRVALEVSDPLKPGLLRGDTSPGFLYLLMPVRL
jgi:DNA polymerase III subunit beta